MLFKWPGSCSKFNEIKLKKELISKIDKTHCLVGEKKDRNQVALSRRKLVDWSGILKASWIINVDRTPEVAAEIRE